MAARQIILVFLTQNLRNSSKKRLDKNKTDWKRKSAARDVAMQRELSDLIRILPPNILQLMIDFNEACSQDVPTKIVSSLSKTFWNAKLSDLPLQTEGQ